jgi:glycosyltransferase involved in cell wall biosynthesis
MDENLPDLSVVIPILNESRNLAPLLSALDKVFAALAIRWEVVFVDDGSSDDSWLQLLRLSSTRENLCAVRFTRNFGKEAAIQAGLAHSRGPASLVMDCDLQHPAELITPMWNLMQTASFDVVSAVKSRRQAESLIRRTGAGLFYWMFRKSTRIDLESSTDFKLISARARQLYLSLPENQKFFRGLTSWFGFPEGFVLFSPPLRETSRVASPESRWSTGGLFRYALRNLVSFSSFPIRLLGWLGTATLAFSFLLGAQTLYVKFSGQAGEGFTTVIIAILFVGAILMMGLAIIGSYVAETHQQVLQRPQFIIQETTFGSRPTGS